MTSRLEQAMGRLSQAIGMVEDHLAQLPAASASPSAPSAAVVPDSDSLRQEIKDIEAMMSEAIAILEQNATGKQ